MHQTPLEAIAQAICQRKGRYQRNTPLFAQLVDSSCKASP